MSRTFDAYARYYDLLYKDKNYSAEAQYVSSILSRRSGCKAILELGCGTGTHAECLAQAGYAVDGVDISEQMVAQAETRKVALPLELRAKLSFSPGDVRTVRLGKTYDAVISLFHVMSYQSSNTDLSAAFDTAASHLSPGGLFVFDFWYGPAVLTERPSVRVKRLENSEIKVTRIAEPTIRYNENIVDVKYTVFVESKAKGDVEQLTETHTMRYLFLPEILQLVSPKFELLSASAWMTDRTLTETDWSGCVCLVRTNRQ
jgi:SAM-dependent methyltransferase